MSYRILDAESLPEYLRSLPAVVHVLGEGPLSIEEIGDGNLNFVFKVRRTDDHRRSVVVKQAVPYLRMVGEEWPLSRDRMTYEIRALELYNKLVPDLVPEVYHSDEAMSVLVMQCLDDHSILRIGMLEGLQYPNAAKDIGTFLAQTLFHTSAFGMESLERRRLMGQFVLNDELCKLTEEFIFTFPYMDHESNYSNPATDQWVRQNLWADSDYKLGVLKFKDLFLSKADCLLHADLHTGSLMVNEDETFVIDMEFAYFGPFGFDVGKIMANFFLAATSHLARTGGLTYRDWCIDQAFEIWRVFASEFDRLWAAQGQSAMLLPGLLDENEFATLRAATLRHLISDAAGFAACSMARRTVGIAGVADIRDLEDIEARSALEIANLQLSQSLMAAHDSLTEIDEFEQLVRSFYANLSLEI